MLKCRHANSIHWQQNFTLYLSEIICVLVLCLAVSGCQSSGNSRSDININWDIEPAPPTVGVATIDITLTDSTDQLQTGADIQLEGNMSHPGMKPVFAEAEEIKPGQYSAQIEFTMAGDWFILIKSTLDDGTIVERQIEIPRVRSQ